MAILGRGAIGIDFNTGSLIVGRAGLTTELPAGTPNQFLRVNTSGDLFWGELSLSDITDFVSGADTGNVLSWNGSQYNPFTGLSLVNTQEEFNNAASNTNVWSIVLGPGTYTLPSNIRLGVDITGLGAVTLTGSTLINGSGNSTNTVWQNVTITGTITLTDVSDQEHRLNLQSVHTRINNNGFIVNAQSSNIGSSNNSNGQMTLTDCNITGSISVTGGMVAINHSKVTVESAGGTVQITGGELLSTQTRWTNTTGPGVFVNGNNARARVNSPIWTNVNGIFANAINGASISVTDYDFLPSRIIIDNTSRVIRQRQNRQVISTLTAGPAVIWNADNDPWVTMNLDTDVSLTITGGGLGDRIRLELTQASTGGYRILNGGGIRLPLDYPNATHQSPGDVTIFDFVFDGATWTGTKVDVV